MHMDVDDGSASGMFSSTRPVRIIPIEIQKDKVKTNFENEKPSVEINRKISDSKIVDTSPKNIDHKREIPMKSASGNVMSCNSTSTMVISIQMFCYFFSLNVLG
jgi:hypothetical protein